MRENRTSGSIGGPLARGPGAQAWEGRESKRPASPRSAPDQQPAAYLTADSSLRTMSNIGAFAIGAIGLNLLSGHAGQSSLGHAFFMGVRQGFSDATTSHGPAAEPGFGVDDVAGDYGGIVADQPGHHTGHFVRAGPTALRQRSTYLLR